MSNIRSVCAAACALVVACASSARGQESGQIGMAMGYPSSIGVLWHVTDSMAVKPELRMFGSHTEPSSSSLSALTTTFDSSTIAVGIGGQWYLGRWDALRTYVSPKYMYMRSSAKSTSSFSLDPVLLAMFPELRLTIPPNEVKTTTTTHDISGSFGAQYALHKRFSLFGEVGAEYSWLGASDTQSEPLLPARITVAPPPKGHNWGTRTAVGVILYFH